MRDGTRRGRNGGARCSHSRSRARTSVRGRCRSGGGRRGFGSTSPTTGTRTCSGTTCHRRTASGNMSCSRGTSARRRRSSTTTAVGIGTFPTTPGRWRRSSAARWARRSRSTGRDSTGSSSAASATDGSSTVWWTISASTPRCFRMRRSRRSSASIPNLLNRRRRSLTMPRCSPTTDRTRTRAERVWTLTSWLTTASTRSR